MTGLSAKDVVSFLTMTGLIVLGELAANPVLYFRCQCFKRRVHNWKFHVHAMLRRAAKHLLERDAFGPMTGALFVKSPSAGRSESQVYYRHV